MRKRKGFKKWVFHGTFMLLLAIVMAISGMSNTAMAANILVDTDGNGVPSLIGIPSPDLASGVDVTGNNLTTVGTIQGGTLNSTGAATITGLLTANGGITADGGVFTVANTTGAVQTSGTLNVLGATTLGNDMGDTIYLNGTISNSLAATPVTISDDLSVTGTTTTNGISNTGNITNTGNISMATLQTSGLATLNSLSVTNNATVGGTLNVTGASTLGNYGVTNYVYGADNMFLSATGNGLISGSLNLLIAPANMIRGSSYNWIEGPTTISSGYDGAGVPTGNMIDVYGAAITAKTADGAGLTINQGGAGPGVVSLLNSTGHGVTINPTNTVLSGGTSSSSWTMGDSLAELAVGNGATSPPEVSLVRATNTYDGVGGGSTNVSIGEANDNQINVNSFTGTAVTGNFIATAADANGNAVLGVGALPGAFSSYGTGSYIGYDNTNSSTVYGLYADDRSANVGYLNYSAIAAPVYHGLQVTNSETTLSGGTTSTTQAWDNNGSRISDSANGQTFAVDNLGNTSIGLANGSSTATVNGALLVDSNSTGTAGGNTFAVNGSGVSARSNSGLLGLDVNDTNAQIGYQSGTLTNGLQATSGGVVLSSTDTAAYSSTVRLDGTQAYISYNNGATESGLEAGSAGLIVGSTVGATSLGMTTNTSTNEVIVGYMNGTQTYGLHADNGEVNVGYNNTSFHGLTVDGTTNTTTLTGGTNSSSLTLVDGAATLAVGTSAPASEVAVLTATNTAGSTQVRIDSDSIWLNAPTAGVDIWGNVNMHGYNLNGVNDLTTAGNTNLGFIHGGSTTTVNGTFSVDGNGDTAGGNTFAVNGSGILANATDGSNNAVVGVGALPGPYAAYGTGAYIAYENTGTSTVYGLYADDRSVNVGYLNGTGHYEGLQVTDTQTTLSGGTASTTQQWDNNGSRIIDSTNGQTFAVDNNGNTTIGLADGASTATVNGALLADSNGTVTAGGNTLAVNGSGVLANAADGSIMQL